MRNTIESSIQKLCVAIRFLTILPIYWRVHEDAKYYLASSLYFPLVGLVIGVLASLLASVVIIVFPPAVAAAIMVLYFAVISGFLHLDGLADSCDGLMSARSKERSLEIMKDSNTGAMGVVGIVLVLLAKYAGLSAIPMNHLPLACLLIPVAGRCSLLFVMASQKYARQEGSMGSLFFSKKSFRAGMLGSLFFIVCFFSFSSLLTTCICFAVVWLVVYLFGSFSKKRIGGATGDTLGATVEISEMAVALVLSGLFYII